MPPISSKAAVCRFLQQSSCLRSAKAQAPGTPNLQKSKTLNPATPNPRAKSVLRPRRSSSWSRLGSITASAADQLEWRAVSVFLQELHRGCSLCALMALLSWLKLC